MGYSNGYIFNFFFSLFPLYSISLSTLLEFETNVSLDVAFLVRWRGEWDWRYRDYGLVVEANGIGYKSQCFWVSIQRISELKFHFFTIYLVISLLHSFSVSLNLPCNGSLIVYDESHSMYVCEFYIGGFS